MKYLLLILGLLIIFIRILRSGGSEENIPFFQKVFQAITPDDPLTFDTDIQEQHTNSGIEFEVAVRIKSSQLSIKYWRSQDEGGLKESADILLLGSNRSKFVYFLDSEPTSWGVLGGTLKSELTEQEKLIAKSLLREIRACLK